MKDGKLRLRGLPARLITVATLAQLTYALQVQTKPPYVPPRAAPARVAPAPAPAPAAPHPAPAAPRPATPPPSRPEAPVNPAAGVRRSPAAGPPAPGRSGGTGSPPTPRPAPPKSYAPKSAGGGEASHPSTSDSRPVKSFTPAGPATATAPKPGDSSVAGSSGSSVSYMPHAAPSAPLSRSAPAAATREPVKTTAGTPANTSPAPESRTVSPNAIPVATNPIKASTTSARAAYLAPPPAGVASRSADGGSNLTAAASRTLIQQVNAKKSDLKGINSRPLPTGAVTLLKNGDFRLKAADGATYNVLKNGRVASATRGGRTVSYGSDGRVNAIHSASLDIRYGPHGEQRIISHPTADSTLVNTGNGRGYLEKTVVAGDRTLIQRSFFGTDGARTRFYTTYDFGGVALPYYTPSVYYGAAFYGWAYYPWPSSIGFAWNGPGVGLYSGYFSPVGTYASAAAWLTDYILGRTLGDAYSGDEAGQADEAADAGDAHSAPRDAPITPALRVAFVDEVQRQLGYENAIASNTAPATVAQLPPALKPDRIFVVSSALEVTTADEQQCSLRGGDVLQVARALPDGSLVVPMRVASSRRADCPSGVEIALSIQDLAEMQNSARARMDEGLVAMRSGQGENGLPSIPPVALGPEPHAALSYVPPAGDQDIGAMLREQQDAAKTEAAALRETGAEIHK